MPGNFIIAPELPDISSTEVRKALREEHGILVDGRVSHCVVIMSLSHLKFALQTVCFAFFCHVFCYAFVVLV